ncbi:hypothetical protein Cfor_12036 [Coptotermes formosanus]|uniref:Uncharacterized protein n=1 Tax=Coptotermes formosanus TaxID=36987 RepID=A0A6L2Q7E2_COPFO|nr:hypothetical protein Cfor_12036 [Coptotermes formosanus]
MTLCNTLTNWFSSNVDSLSLNFHWNSLKFLERFCTKLSQKNLVTTSFVPDGCSAPRRQLSLMWGYRNLCHARTGASIQRVIMSRSSLRM